MKSVIRNVILATLLMLPFAGTASAQYLWMDTNGDGVNTAADVMNPNGTGTTVDVYINTSHNKDGSTAVCQSGDPDAWLQSWNSIGTHINVFSGTAAFANYIPQPAIRDWAIKCANYPDPANPGQTKWADTTSTAEFAQCQAAGAAVLTAA